MPSRPKYSAPASAGVRHSSDERRLPGPVVRAVNPRERVHREPWPWPARSFDPLSGRSARNSGSTGSRAGSLGANACCEQRGPSPALGLSCVPTHLILKPAFSSFWKVLTDRKETSQPLAVDRSARGSMKTAAKCAAACESQDYQMHRPVERTLRPRHCQVSWPLPDECLYTHPASIPSDRRASRSPRSGGRSADARGVLGLRGPYT